MTEYMDFFSNSTTTIFDQSVIYQHPFHPRHSDPLDFFFVEIPKSSASCQFMDATSSSMFNIPITTTATTTNTNTTVSGDNNKNKNNNNNNNNNNEQLQQQLTKKRSREDVVTPNKRKLGHQRQSAQPSSSSTSSSQQHKQASSSSSTSSTSSLSLSVRSSPKDILQLQDNLDYLQDEWATIDIVLQSLKSAFTVYPSKMSTEEYLDEIDRELAIAYDDLMAQVRSLDRNLKRLDVKIKAHHPTPTTTPIAGPLPTLNSNTVSNPPSHKSSP